MPVSWLVNRARTDRTDCLPDGDRHGPGIHGGNGRDEISVAGSHLTLSGGNGGDSLAVAGFYNLLEGGNGADWLGANGRDNTLRGGNGDDVLLSTAGGGTYEVAGGNLLEGGRGDDVFVPLGTKDLVVVSGTEDGLVSAGDIVTGVFDIILDYGPGDVIQTNATRRIEQVGFDPYELPPPYVHPNTADHQHLLLGAGEYAIFRGDRIAAGRFMVTEDGEDLLLVWDDAGFDSHIFQFGVVIQGFTDADAVILV